MDDGPPKQPANQQCCVLWPSPSHKMHLLQTAETKPAGSKQEMTV
jgi:hypothetical protein